jgi:DNA-binding GntR family transcriptional regulator
MAQKPTKKTLVYEQLKNAIISGEIKPGEILNEAVLAEKYKMGKTPTREALLLLANENFLDSMPRVGYVVTRLTVQDMLEIFSLRILLEVEAIGIAAEKITEDCLAKLSANSQEEKALARQQADVTVLEKGHKLNREFHLIIAEAAGNHRLARLIRGLIDDLERALSFDPYIADPTQHVEIIRHLKNRDKVKAQDAMRRHIEETRNRILNRV